MCKFQSKPTSFLQSVHGISILSIFHETIRCLINVFYVMSEAKSFKIEKNILLLYLKSPQIKQIKFNPKNLT